MLITKKLNIIWKPVIRKYYESKGYLFSKYGKSFEINILDLPKCSMQKVETECDHCKKIRIIPYLRVNKQGNFCHKCSLKVALGVKMETVSKKFKEKGLDLISTGIKDCFDTLFFKCKKHPEITQSTSWSWINSKNSKNCCKLCHRGTLRECLKTKFNLVEEMFKKRNYILISKEAEYINNSTKLQYFCTNFKHGKRTITFADLKSGYGCYKCNREKQTGPNNKFWKGGKSTVLKYFRKFIGEWKKRSMEACNYKCFLSGEPFAAIHHLYSFQLIVEECFRETNIPFKNKLEEYNIEELEGITRLCVEKHKNYPLGVCLSSRLHKQFHFLYGRVTTPVQFEEFKVRYQKGEFNNALL